MKEEMMNWTREDQVKWVANEIRVADREYYAYEKEHGKDRKSVV